MLFDHFGGRFLINVGLQNRSKNGSKKSSILGCIFGPIFVEIWLQVGPGADAIAGKSASWGGLRRPGNVAFICCPSWLRLGGPLNRIWENLGTILVPKMAPKSDLGRIWAPKNQILAPKRFPKLTKNPSTLSNVIRPF